MILTQSEITVGFVVGGLREAASAGRANRYPDPPTDGHILGALGECFIARHSGRYWPMTVNAGKAPDIGPNIQVRARRFDPVGGQHDLCMRPGDDPEHWYVLAHCHEFPHSWEVVGYIRGRDALAVGREHAGRVWVAPGQLTK